VSGPTCRCGRPTSGASLCQKCSARTLPIALANIAAYVADLDTMRARRRAVRYDLPRGKGGSKEIPLPLDGRFVDVRREVEVQQPDGGVVRLMVGEESRGTKVADETRNTITTWTRIVLDEWPPITAPVCDDALCRRCNPLRAAAWIRHEPRAQQGRDGRPTVSTRSACAYLLRMIPHIASADWAGELLEELLHVEGQLRKLVDNPPERWYAGPCTAGQEDLAYAALCGAELYANVDRDVVRCPECETVYAIADRQAWLLAAAEDRLETATNLAHALVRLAGLETDETRLANRIVQWAKRGRIQPRDTVLEGGKERPRYRVGDAMDLILESAENERKRASGEVSC
jgi:hypothetical protein